MPNLKINYRHPFFKEGLAIYELVKRCPPLDTNSLYYYYLLCRDFSKTCVVAERDNHIISFLSAYRKPQEQDCLFVWQVAVSKDARGQHIATNMLDWLMEQLDEATIRILETTISPSNHASQALFRQFAKKYQGICETNDFIDMAMFGDQAHEAEILFRIGPLKR
ncbi:MAG: diaminobutyrate acetyltransferase [Candidatus Parabeggiatoa sp.]|nr:diaminobutyrate acetyltransferase [Candidatus Parabeggiatoa sp.]